MDNLLITDLSIVSLAQKLNTKENYNQEGVEDAKQTITIGLTFIMLIFFIIIALWAWSLYALIHYWNFIPTWAKVIGVIGVIPVIPFGPIITLIVVYATHKQN